MPLVCKTCCALPTEPCRGLLTGRAMTQRHAGELVHMGLSAMMEHFEARNVLWTADTSHPGLTDRQKALVEKPNDHLPSVRYWTLYREIEAQLHERYPGLIRTDRKAFDALHRAELAQRAEPYSDPPRPVSSGLTPRQLSQMVFHDDHRALWGRT